MYRFSLYLMGSLAIVSGIAWITGVIIVNLPQEHQVTNPGITTSVRSAARP
jgi:hypothetical protein